MSQALHDRQRGLVDVKLVNESWLAVHSAGIINLKMWKQCKKSWGCWGSMLHHQQRAQRSQVDFRKRLYVTYDIGVPRSAWFVPFECFKTYAKQP
jgi:hypothetical protein